LTWNFDFRKADYGRGKRSDKYTRKRLQVVYKCKWIVGTEYCYDWGLATDLKRAADPKKKAKTTLSYNFYAYNFSNMRAQGFMERLIPFLDDYQLTCLKMQNFKNRAVPSGWWIDLDGLENAALNKGGKNMEAPELLRMFFETGLLAGRSQDAAGNSMGQNWKPIIPIENSIVQELVGFYNDLMNTVMAIEKMTGYNEITSGNPDPKTLTPGYEIANASTNDALYALAFAESQITEKLAEDVLMRMKQGIKKGGVSGYAPALNVNTLRFIQLSDDLPLRDHGIMLEEKTTDEQKLWLLQQMQADITNGFLDVSDAVLIINTHNAKQAQQIWAYRVKKSKEALRLQKLQEIQMTNEGNAQAAQIASQERMATKQMEVQARLQEEQMRINGELAKERMRLEASLAEKQLEIMGKRQISTEANQVKLAAAEIAADSKIESQIISTEGDIEKTEIAGELAKEKQQIQNKKPQSTSKK
jgi:hypothetical protein